MLKNKNTLTLSLLSLCVLLNACAEGTDVKESLGLNRKAPDEFQVLSRPPLSVPPEFNLRPPGKGSEYLSGTPAQDQAHSQVLGSSTAPGTQAVAPVPVAATAIPFVSTGELPSGADSQFLSNAGAYKANPNVRQIITDDKENGVAPKDTTYLLGTSKEDESLVDSTKEAQRIKDNKAQNKPVTTGDTPVIVPKDRGILGDLF